MPTIRIKYTTPGANDMNIITEHFGGACLILTSNIYFRLHLIKVSGITIASSKELSMASRKKVVDAHETGEGFKKTSKQL